MAPKILVLDDDPTGSQTVHSCLLLTQWDPATLLVGLRDSSPLLFILTNTRALTPERAAQTTREVCRNLKQALRVAGITDFLVVSRSDSTLRGHYPLETDGIAEELGPFDAHFLVPAFFEGGRVTRGSIHYLYVQGVPTPVHETEFAQDSVFGYHHSYLPDYVAEKTGGRIPADQVERFLLADLRAGVQTRLLGLQGNRCVVVDGEIQSDLDQFAAAVLAAVAQGKRFLFRSGASLITALAHLPPQPVPAEAMANYVRGGAGAVLVGSHVKKTTAQLTQLLQAQGTVPIEVPVARLLETDQAPLLLAEILAKAHAAHYQGLTPVIFTSRTELMFADTQTRLQFGEEVSQLLMQVVQGLPLTLGFLISKGGITSNDVLSKGLNLPMARLLGQVLAGCSVVCSPADHPRFPELPVVLFPGNVGDDQALATVYHRLSQT
ncbi:four-carbon acid sugar kinase family protein [Candidatus Cyanaurora vandensis]|uniref:four-carbon acid sugar kinase family protein n=1 Tax=Candidatus Cyanaurora vandensis TaxID=2714958 RepID=UPI00257D73C6|nr:four-carbon acid sugar kinase family protein [Candidatus Cyanaurora vandensis]